ncbi:hypothetical protein [Bacteriovorax sp. Seq25_V]|uniref:hypothetical protein n=1 Tax=Bacteriovorax sp. Seq25_V TaxID=1201288 RepID=UPI00038A3FD7|nr:hypothetical protein [Bacteriovorax sp. Seq25_V]EQC44313.1 hypothetical protein M900_A0284 [Bacteriovorax sp. Seq25_V]
MFFKKNKKDRVKHFEVFTYFIPAPPVRPTGYREKDFDTICKTLNKYDLDYKILDTIGHTNGFWIIIKIFGDKQKIDYAFNDPRLNDFKIDIDPESFDHGDEPFIIERE